MTLRLMLPVAVLTLVAARSTFAVEQPGSGDPSMPPEAAALLANPIGPEEAVRVALANNRTVRAALQSLGIYEARVTTAGTLRNPEVEFDLRRPANDDKLQTDILIAFDATHAVLTGLRKTAAKTELDAERTKVSAEIVEIGYRVRAAWHAAMASQRQLAVVTRNLDALAAARDAAQALYDAGNVPEVAVASYTAEYEQGRLTVADMELQRVERLEELRRLLGLHGSATTVRLSEKVQDQPMKPPALADVETKAVESSLELQELRKRMEAASAVTKLESTRGAVPEVWVDAHAEQDGNRWEVGGGVVVALPVFDRRQGPRAEAEAQFDTLQDNLEAAAVEIRSAARETRARVESAYGRVRHYDERVLPARRRALDATMLQYNAMQIGVFDVLVAKRLLLEAELGRVAAVRDYWTAMTGTDALMAGRRVAAMRSSGGVTPSTLMFLSEEAGGGH